MTGAWRWVGLAAIAAVVTVLVLVTAPPPESPAHQATSDAGGGTSALRQLASARGHATGLIEGDFDLPPGGAVFMFTPTVPVSQTEADRLVAWVRAGGHLVYAAETATPPLDASLGLRRDPAGGSQSAGDPALLPEIRNVAGRYASVFAPAAGQNVVLRDSSKRAVGVGFDLGSGSVVAITAAEALANGFIEKADNAVLAAALVDLAGDGGIVRFDEYHHGARAGGDAVNALYAFPWGRALVWSVIVVFVGLAVRGRVIGSPEPPAGGPAPSMDEHTTAVARLLSDVGGRRLTLDVLTAAARRSLARRLGVGIDPSRPDLDAMLLRFDRDLAGRLEHAERLAGPDPTAAELVAAARELHALAYPMAPATAKR